MLRNLRLLNQTVNVFNHVHKLQKISQGIHIFFKKQVKKQRRRIE